MGTAWSCPCREPHDTHQLWHSIVASCPGHSSWVPLPPFSPQRHWAVGTHTPSCSSCPCGHRHPAGQWGGMAPWCCKCLGGWTQGGVHGGAIPGLQPPCTHSTCCQRSVQARGQLFAQVAVNILPCSSQSSPGHSSLVSAPVWVGVPGWGRDGGLPGHTAVLQPSLWVCAPRHCLLPARCWSWRCRRRKLPLQGCWQGPHGPQGLQRHSSMGCWCHSGGDTGSPSPPCPAALRYLGRCQGLGRAAAAAAQLSTQLHLQTKGGRSVGPGRLGSGAALTRVV